MDLALIRLFCVEMLACASPVLVTGNVHRTMMSFPRRCASKCHLFAIFWFVFAIYQVYIFFASVLTIVCHYSITIYGKYTIII